MLASLSSRFTFLISTLKLTRIENYYVDVWLELILESKSSFRPRHSDGVIARLVVYVELELGEVFSLINQPLHSEEQNLRPGGIHWFTQGPELKSRMEPRSPVSASRSVRFSFHEPGHQKCPCHE